MTRENAYKLLDLPLNVKDEEEIKRAFKKLAMKHHPDKGGNEENFKKIQEAKNVLLKKEEFKYELNGRKFTQSEYDEVIREYLKKSHEDLNVYEARIKAGSKTGLIRMFLCVVLILKILIFSIFGISTAKMSIISLIIWGLLMYMAPLFSDIHDMWILYKNEKKNNKNN